MRSGSLILLVLLIALAAPASAQQFHPRAWLVVEDLGGGVVRPVLYIQGVAPPGALELSGWAEAGNDSARIAVSASVPLLTGLLAQRGVDSLAVSLVLEKPAGEEKISGEGRLDAVTRRGNLSINMVRVELERLDAGSRLLVSLEGIRGNITAGDVAGYLSSILGMVLAPGKYNVTVDNNSVRLEALIGDARLGGLLRGDIQGEGTLILIVNGGNATLTVNATITGNVTGLFKSLVPAGEGYRPLLPARSTIETLDNGTLKVVMPRLILEGITPEEAAEDLSVQLGEVLGGEINYTITKHTPTPGPTTASTTPASPAPQAQTPGGAEASPRGGRGSLAAYAASAVVVAVVLAALAKRLRG